MASPRVSGMRRHHTAAVRRVRAHQARTSSTGPVVILIVRGGPQGHGFCEGGVSEWAVEGEAARSPWAARSQGRLTPGGPPPAPLSPTPGGEVSAQRGGSEIRSRRPPSRLTGGPAAALQLLPPEG